MSASSDDLERRVSALEAKVDRVAQDAAAARVLAGGADRDVSETRTELRGHTKVLNALRETQVEHGQKIDRLEDKVEGLDRKVEGLDRKVEEGFAMMSTGMAQITALIKNSMGPETEGD